MDKRLEKIIRQVFVRLDGKEIDATWTSDDVDGWDSFGHLTLIVAVEKEFSIKFEVEELFKIRSFSDVEQILQEKRGCQ